MTATANVHTSLDASWTAPANDGRPDIGDYDLRYCAGVPADCDADDDFTAGPQGVEVLNAVIGSLMGDTIYQVQVRATNEEGDGAWSPSAQGRTNTPGNATGAPVITGFAQVGQTLTAGEGDIADPNGLPGTAFPEGYSFQWVRVDAGRETDIPGANSRSYAPTAADLGRTVQVEVSFTDTGGEAEKRTSLATGEVVAAARACSVGNLWCATLTVGEGSGSGGGTPRGYCDPASGRCDATNEYGSLTDNDFILDGTTYVVESLRWTSPMGSGNSLHLTLDRDFSDAALPRVTLKVDSHIYNPRFSNRENDRNNVDNNYQFFAPTAIQNYPVGFQVTVELLPNNPATGAPVITGTAEVGQTLTASTADIMDADGLTSPTYSYQWFREDADGSNRTFINLAQSRTYTLVETDDGKRMRVSVIFVDDNGAREELFSEPTYVVGNNAPEFSATTLTRSIPQNSAADVNAGPPIPAATDADNNNPLVYSMSGPDAASFAFDVMTRQISTISGVTYSRDAYSVVVEANDGEGGTGAVDVTIRTLDPNLPRPPSVGAALVSNFDVQPGRKRRNTRRRHLGPQGQRPGLHHRRRSHGLHNDQRRVPRLHRQSHRVRLHRQPLDRQFVRQAARPGGDAHEPAFRDRGRRV